MHMRRNWSRLQKSIFIFTYGFLGVARTQKNIFAGESLKESDTKMSLFSYVGLLSGPLAKIFTLVHWIFFSPPLSLFPLIHFNVFTSSLFLSLLFSLLTLSFSPLLFSERTGRERWPARRHRQ